MKYLSFIAILALAACGVDGEPKPKQSGLDISGTAKIGVSGTL